MPTRTFLRDLYNLWYYKGTILSTPSGTNDLKGNPEAAPVGPEHPLPTGLYVFRDGAWVPWDGYATVRPTIVNPFQAQSLTATDPTPAYTGEFALNQGQNLTVSMDGAVGPNGTEEITLEGWDGSVWNPLSVQGIFSESPSATLNNSTDCSKYRVKFSYLAGADGTGPSATVNLALIP